MIFSIESKEKLMLSVKNTLSKARYNHTLGVVNAALILSEYCLPNSAEELEIAALLHDITKEYSNKSQLDIINKTGLTLSSEDMESPQILHSFTAKFEISEKYPEFATENILSAVYNHTIGAPDMTDFDEIIFLADFIEENRKYEASLKVREYVFKNMKTGLYEDNLKILHKACVMAIDYTILHLIAGYRIINSKNILTRNALLSKI